MVNTVTLIQDIEGSLILHCSQNEANETDSKDNSESVYERLCLPVRVSCSVRKWTKLWGSSNLNHRTNWYRFRKPQGDYTTTGCPEEWVSPVVSHNPEPRLAIPVSCPRSSQVFWLEGWGAMCVNETAHLLSFTLLDRVGEGTYLSIW